MRAVLRGEGNWTREVLRLVRKTAPQGSEARKQAKAGFRGDKVPSITHFISTTYKGDFTRK
jgi:hypothetical protein